MGYLVKLFLKCGALLIGILWVMVPEVFAFSIGEFQVESRFGEKFNASLENQSGFRRACGSESGGCG